MVESLMLIQREGVVAGTRYDISGPGFLRAVQRAHASGKQLVVVTDRDSLGQIVRLGFFLDPSEGEPPEITWFRQGEIEVNARPTDGVPLADGRLDVAFQHPKKHERHFLLNIPAGDDYTVVLRVLFRVGNDGVGAFVIQAELRGTIDGSVGWRPVARYDCAHGFIHRDLLARDGTRSKAPVAVPGPAEAIPLAFDDMRLHLADWMADLGYQEPETARLSHPTLADELMAAQSTLLGMMRDPESMVGVSSRSVVFQDQIPQRSANADCPLSDGVADSGPFAAGPGDEC